MTLDQRGVSDCSNPVDLSKYNLLPSIPIPIEFQPIRELKSVPAGGLGGAAEKREFLLRDYFNLSLFSLQEKLGLALPHAISIKSKIAISKSIEIEKRVCK